MRIGRANHKDEEARIVAQRQKIITYKQFFASENGRTVLVDLMDRFSLAFSLKPDASLSADRVLGRNDVIAYILNQTEMPMEQFDKIVKGDKA